MEKFSQRDISTMVKMVMNEISSKSKTVLEEGKRDNQLIPYLNILNEKTGKNISLGEFKTMMLRKLSTEGGMHNISLQSNYYLVGAIRYYFEGLLTTTPELGVLTDSLDNWNTDVCKKLNALILVLRNGYIDSVGTTWVEPEDFGTMNLKDLFTKYKKEIKKVLDKNKPLTNTQTDEIPKEYVMNNPNYTYDIIYNFDDATKYNEATSPGAWCITYGRNFLRSYTSAGNGHFVVFAKKGYENIPRKKQPEKWIGRKPQDDYGNSLIAYLQSNSDPGPANYNGAPLITSRWNHGYDSISCEADKAYTQEEFERITGVSKADLKGIYDTWKAFAPLRSDNFKEKENKEKPTVDDIRALKYVQMRINGGENPENLMANYIPSSFTNISSIKNNDRYIFFVIVGKKILFETASIGSGSIRVLGKRLNVMYYQFADNKRFFIVNLRTKSLVNIEDMWTFKAIHFGRFDNPDTNSEMANSLVSVKQANIEIALLDEKTGMPLKLPNGHCWFNEIYAGWSASQKHGKVRCNRFYKNRVYEITYDLSSGEKYFYDSMHNRFLDFGQNNGDKKFYLCQENAFGESDYVGILVAEPGIKLRSEYGWYWNNRHVDGVDERLFKDGKPVSITFKINGQLYKVGENGPKNAIKINFENVDNIGNNFFQIRIEVDDDTYDSSNTRAIIYDGNNYSVLLSPDGKTPFILTGHNARYKSVDLIYNIILAIEKGPIDGESIYMLYNTNEKKYIENPYNFPSRYEFLEVESYERSNKLIEFLPKQIIDDGNLPYSEYCKLKRKIAVYYDPFNNKFKKKVEGKKDKETGESLDDDENYIDDPAIYGGPSYSLTEQDIVRMVRRVTSKINELCKDRK